jgi:hypothetical protein
MLFILKKNNTFQLYLYYLQLKLENLNIYLKGFFGFEKLKLLQNNFLYLK